MRFFILMITVISLLSMSQSAYAQDWWNKAKDIFNSDTSNQVLDTLGKNKSSANLSQLTNTEIAAGLREALTVGTEKVVGQLGVTDGFNLDPKIHIPLPGTLKKVDTALSAVGMNSLTDELELRLNRAAELSTQKAKKLFIIAIQEMTIEDAKNILTGSEDAATQYLRKTMGPGLNEEMQPIVQKSLASAGAIKVYDDMMGEYAQIPFMPDVKANLNNYVVEKAMDGIFYYVAQEEKAIRENPFARTTDLLKKVFAN